MAEARPAASAPAVNPFVPQSFDQAKELARSLAGSGLLPQELRGKPNDLLIILLSGIEMGLMPMQSIRGLNVVAGKVVMSADLMVAQARRSPVCEYFELVETTAERATYETKRRGAKTPTRLTFTIEEAQQAGLFAGNDNWQRYPAAMLRARCSAQLARAVYQDLLLGVFDLDEARDFLRARPAEQEKQGGRQRGGGQQQKKGAPAQQQQQAPAAPAEPPTETATAAAVPAPGAEPAPAQQPAPAPAGPTLADELAATIRGAKDADALRAAGEVVRARRDEGKLNPDELALLEQVWRDRDAALRRAPRAA